MNVLNETNLKVDIVEGSEIYLDVTKDLKTTRRKVYIHQYSEGGSLKQTCFIRDEQTGTRVTSKGWGSVNGSYKHASKDLVRKLIVNKQL